MKKIVFIVEKTSDGFSAFAEDAANIPAFTGGDTMAEVRTNILDAYNSVADLRGWPAATMSDITVQINVAQFLEHYKLTNVLGSRIGMSKSLLSQYASGHKKAGPKQIDRIMKGIQDLGRELATLELV
jgi:hypothetical protein